MAPNNTQIHRIYVYDAATGDAILDQPAEVDMGRCLADHLGFCYGAIPKTRLQAGRSYYIASSENVSADSFYEMSDPATGCVACNNFSSRQHGNSPIYIGCVRILTRVVMGANDSSICCSYPPLRISPATRCSPTRPCRGSMSHRDGSSIMSYRGAAQPRWQSQVVGRASLQHGASEWIVVRRSSAGSEVDTSFGPLNMLLV